MIYDGEWILVVKKEEQTHFSTQNVWANQTTKDNIAQNEVFNLHFLQKILKSL